LNKDLEGRPHCSYEDGFVLVEQLEGPEDTSMSSLEYVENQLYQVDGFEELLEAIPGEDIRRESAPPPQVGTLCYENGEITDLVFDLPGDFSEW